jgi:hypothetical protein
VAFFVPSIQFFFGLPRALFCFCIHSRRYYTSHVEYKILYQNMPDYQPLRHYERVMRGRSCWRHCAIDSRWCHWNFSLT